MRSGPLVLVAALLAVASCSDTQSKRCELVCQKETDCAERRNSTGNATPYDLDECIAACVALERDKEGEKLVQKHIECAKEAGDDCAKLERCR